MARSKRIMGLLFEAYRRNQMFDPHEQDKPLIERWLGLGTEAAYRPAINAGLFRFHDGRIPPKRCMGWLCLTPAGVSAMLEYQTKFEAILNSWKALGYEQSILGQYQLAGGITTY